MTRRIILVVILGLGLTACPAASETVTGGFRPSLEPTVCPEDVSVQLLVAHTCATLTTLLDRAAPTGPTVRSLVVTITPSTVSHTDPVVIVGDDVGAPPDYGAHQAEAERLQRVVYLLEQRGTGHGEPSLACPALDGGQIASARRLLAAVESCRASSAARGLVPTDFDAAAMAGDVEDLRRALGVQSWNIEAFGTSWPIATAFLAQDAAAVRAMVIDSPSVLIGAPVDAADATASVFRQLFHRCRADASCGDRYGDLASVWEAAVTRFRAQPTPSWEGAEAVDDGDLVRTLRSAIASDQADVTRFPTIVSAASKGRLDPDLLTVRASGGAMCVGYVSDCGRGVATGAVLSVLCGRFDLPRASIPATEEPTGVRGAFSSDPYPRACDTWWQGAGDDAPAVPSTSVPVLVVSGSFDPFTPPRATRAVAKAFGMANVLIVDGSVRRPLTSSACALEERDTWLQAPGTPVRRHCRQTSSRS